MMVLTFALFACLSVWRVPQAGGQASTPSTGSTPEATVLEAPALKRTEQDWLERERELMDRIRNLELELAQEQALRFEREREWVEFTKLLSLLPAERRPAIPDFLDAGAEEAPVPTEPNPLELAERQSRERAQAIKSSLRAYLRAEGVRALDLMEVGLLQDGAIGPIVARQLDNQGRFVSTLVADRLRLEKSQTGYHVTLVLERGYERRAGQVWPFPEPKAGGAPVAIPSEQAEDSATWRSGVLRIPLTGVRPDPWIEAMPELFSAQDREHTVDDGSTNLIGLRYSLNQLLDHRHGGARWKLVSIGGIVGKEWRDVHFAELALDGQVIRRLFADRVRLRLEGNNALFELQDGAQERAGKRAPFLGGRYTLVLPGIDLAAWRGLNLPGLDPGP
ncbi:MAG: hypothetical protein H6829_04170 [Planctomycetes bacterium]|nr:hypothetical protein [Planctomycetota bacterium]